MEYPHMRHPEFGLLCPPPRLLRELRIAFTFLLIGGIAGALCGSGVLGLRHSETASLAEHGSLKSTVGSNASSPPKIAGRHGARPASKLRVECSQTRACCSRGGAAIIRRRSQSAGRPHPRTRGEPGHSATSAGPRAEPHSSIGAKRYPPRLNSDLGALCGAGRVNRGPVPDIGHPIRCKRATVQVNRRRGRRRRVALRTIVATSPGMIIRGVIILPIIGARAERSRMTSAAARGAAHMRARVPIP